MAGAHLKPRFDSANKNWNLANHEHIPQKVQESMEKTYHSPFCGEDHSSHRRADPEVGPNHGQARGTARGTTHVTPIRTPCPNHGVRPHFVQVHDSLLLAPVSSCLPRHVLAFLTKHTNSQYKPPLL